MEFEFIDRDGIPRSGNGDAEFAALVNQGVISSGTLVRYKGTNGWTPARELLRFILRNQTNSASSVRHDVAPETPPPPVFPLHSSPVQSKSTEQATSVTSDQIPVQTVREVVQDAGLYLVVTAAMAERGQKAFSAFLASCILYAAGQLLPALASLVYISQLRNLVQTYGFGRVPIEQVNAIGIPSGLWLGSILAVIASSICFCVMLYQPNRALYEVGVANQKWTAGWTVASLFIPILNLYRPWAGLSEADTSIRYLAKTPRDRMPINPKRSLSWRTVIYATSLLVLFASTRILQGISNTFERTTLPTTLAEFDNYTSTVNSLSVTFAGFTLAILIANALYWLPMIARMNSIGGR